MNDKHGGFLSALVLGALVGIALARIVSGREGTGAVGASDRVLDQSRAGLRARFEGASPGAAETAPPAQGS